MSERLPPLNALKAFEAAARHLSVKRAAEELNVTPAAISHQIKALEEFLGVSLFKRVNRGLELAPPARAALPKLSEGFATIAQAMALARPGRESPRLTVNVPPSFAARWLMPRLHRFFAAHPGIDLRVAARLRLPHEGTQGVAVERTTVENWLAESDVAILYGHGDYPGFRVDKLLTLTVAPICSPQLLQGTHPLLTPHDLEHHTLVHDDSGALYDGVAFWDVWLKAAGVTDVDSSRGSHFSQPVLALEAALDALGVVATFPVLAETELAAGRLILPFELQVPIASGYYLVCKESAVARAPVTAFRTWVLSETQTGHNLTAV